MITFLNGRSISTAVISTACGHDGRGIFPYTTRRDYGDMIRTANATGTTRISKSMTRYKRSGNFHLWRPWTWKYIQALGDDGMLNAYGLTNRGVEAHSHEMVRAMESGIQLIPSFFPEFAKGVEEATEDVCEVVEIFNARLMKNLWALELNFSCPNTEECVTDNVKGALHCVEQVKKQYSNLIVIVKISVVHPPEFARQLREVGADVLHAVNTIPFDLLFPDKISPLFKAGGGGVSGGPAFEMAFEYSMKAAGYFGGPVIFGCGITDDEKLRRYIEAMERYGNPREWTGISLSLCTAALRFPDWVRGKILDFNSEL